MHKGLMPSRETQVRFLRFLSVGGFAAVVQFLTLNVFRSWFGPNLAFNCSFVCSTSTHYLMNRFWALPSDRNDAWKQFTEYLVTSSISWGINFTLYKICLDLVGLSVMWSAVVALPPSTVVVFLILNYRVFRRRSGKADLQGHSS
jgi:putative flippase GtrA